MQTPLPVHWLYATPPEQVPHAVPAAQSAQAPDPSHDPVVPQVDDAVAAHWLRGSLPGANTVQVPSAQAPIAAVHARQSPVQALSQQTPWAQTLLRHWPGVVHGVPFACMARQTPLEQ